MANLRRNSYFPLRSLMQGKVKWFSVDKGYGFVVGEDDIERHFGVQDVKGAELPRNGDKVTFTPQQGKKGPRATGMEIVARAAAKNDDDRVKCAHCGKRMVPRIITDRGSLSKSVCPFCGGTHKDFGWCFIASVVYEPHEPELHALRRIRDNRLRPTLSGRSFIKVYYHLSPPVARVLAKSPRGRRLARSVLNLIARRDF